MFNSFYCNKCQHAQPIEKLIERFTEKGTEGLDVAQSEELQFTAEEWNSWDETKQQEVLMNYRIAYLGETMVNWCAGLGTVLANDEVVDGVSVRGGFPVVQKKMRQWCLRVSAFLFLGWKSFDYPSHCSMLAPVRWTFIYFTTSSYLVSCCPMPIS